MNSSTKGLHIQAAAFNNAFQGADWKCFAAMHCHDHLAAIVVTPFLVAARLGNHRKTILSQNFDNFPCAANWMPPAHGTASSIILAPLGNLIGAGLNQSASAFWALANGFRFGVARGGAAGQFGEHSRPTFGLWIKFNQQPEFHYQNNSCGRASKQRSLPAGGTAAACAGPS